MKITKKRREEAALICQVAASTPTTLYDAACSLGLGNEAHDLARDAWFEVCHLHDDHEQDAAAEALLRTRWCPRG